MQTILLVAIGLGLLSVVLVQRSHMRWVRRELQKNTLAHGRIVRALPVRRREHAPFRLERTQCFDWSDDRISTRVLPRNQYPNEYESAQSASVIMEPSSEQTDAYLDPSLYDADSRWPYDEPR